VYTLVEFEFVADLDVSFVFCACVVLFSRRRSKDRFVGGACSVFMVFEVSVVESTKLGFLWRGGRV
jgi:hypothetical protein